MSCSGFLREEGRRVLRRGSEKGLSRRHVEEETRLFGEYDPCRVRPIEALSRGIECLCLSTVGVVLSTVEGVIQVHFHCLLD